jgi:hypothetical protein
MLDGKANGHRCVNKLRAYKPLVFAGRIPFFEVVLKLEFCSTCHCAMESLITFAPANLAKKAIMEAACIAFIAQCIPELCSLDLDRSNVERTALAAFFITPVSTVAWLWQHTIIIWRSATVLGSSLRSFS